MGRKVESKNLETVTVINFFFFFPSQCLEWKHLLVHQQEQRPRSHCNGVKSTGMFCVALQPQSIQLLQEVDRTIQRGNRCLACLTFFFFWGVGVLLIYYRGTLLFYWDNWEEMESWPQRRAQVTVCNWKQPHSEKEKGTVITMGTESPCIFVYLLHKRIDSSFRPLPSVRLSSPQRESWLNEKKWKEPVRTGPRSIRANVLPCSSPRCEELARWLLSLPAVNRPRSPQNDSKSKTTPLARKDDAIRRSHPWKAVSFAAADAREDAF